MEKLILIIDDYEADIKLIEEVIEQTEVKCRITTAESGEEGVEMAEKMKPDLILIDASMPGMDGFETCRQIKKLKSFDAKVIMITGKLSFYDKKKALEAGADDYIIKLAEPLLEAFLMFIIQKS